MGAGWDISGASSSVGRHSGGAGGFYGQVTPPRDAGVVPGIERSFDMLSKGIDSFAQNRINRDKMDMEKAKFSQNMELQQAKLDMAKEENQLQAMKYASAMQQQEFDNNLKIEDNRRKQLKSELELINFQNKEALGTTIRNSIDTFSKVLDGGSIEDLYSSDEYKTYLSALSAVDPEAAIETVNKALTKKAELDKNKRAVGTYNITSNLYIEELPKVYEAIDNGTPISEAVEPIRLRLAELYKSGNVDHKAVTDQLKSILGMVQTYKKKSGSSSLVSFDSQGNQVDPLSGADVTKQVDPLTGKVTFPGGQKKKSLAQELQELKDMQEKGEL